MPSIYQAVIVDELAARGLAGRYEPRHIEAYLRSEHGTLDSLERTRFAAGEVLAAVDADPSLAEQLAQSYGL